MYTTKMKSKSTTGQKICVYLILGLSTVSFITIAGAASRTQKTVQSQSPKELQLVEEIEMKITFYCKNSCCCGKFADGITASGVPAVGLIVAADTDYYPFGTKMTIDGVTYTVQDRGGAIKGPNRIDILCIDHFEANQRGRINRIVKIERY